jgi:hypothetical protein
LWSSVDEKLTCDISTSTSHCFDDAARNWAVDCVRIVYEEGPGPDKRGRWGIAVGNYIWICRGSGFWSQSCNTINLSLSDHIVVNLLRLKPVGTLYADVLAPAVIYG